MVDDMNNISLKIKSFVENVTYDGSFRDSASYEEEICNDDRIRDRFCAQCGEDHTFKPNFNGIKTSIERIPELIPLIFEED